MSRIARAIVALTAASASLAGCVFDDAVGDDAVVLCADDDACARGFVCDLAAHVCVAPGVVADVTAPAVESVVVDRAFAKDGDAVIVTIDADEDVSDAALVAAPGSAGLAFTAERDADVVAFRVVIAGDVAEGSYVFDHVDLDDAAGNHARRALDGVAFRVDRTAPAVFGLDARGENADGIVADVAEHEGVDVEFFVDEAVERATAVFRDSPAAPAVCDVSDSLRFSCALRIDDAIGNGPASVDVVVVDRAGNETRASTSIDVDTRAPAVVAGSVRAALVDDDGDTVGVLAPGGALRLEFVLDEDNDGTPAVRLRLGALTFDLVVTATGGDRRRFTALLDDAAIESSGTATLEVDTRDPVGHAATAPLVLEAPLVAGVPVVASAPSRCENPTPAGCPDVDGDGALGSDDDCVAPAGADLDCDDEDPFVYPGALELPGDGRDNDCLGDGDLADDEAHAVFMRCDRENSDAGCADGVADDGSNDGSRAAPFDDFLVALAEADASGRVVIAAGDIQFDERLVTLAVPVFGGFNADDGWTRLPTPGGVRLISTTNLRNGSFLVLTGVADVDGSDATLTLGPGVDVVRSQANYELTGAGAHVVDSTGNLSVGSRDAIVVGSTFDSIFAAQGSSIAITRSAAHRLEFIGERADVVGYSGGLTVASGTINVWHSELTTVEVRGGAATLVNSVIAPPLGAPAFDICVTCDRATFAFASVGVVASGPLMHWNGTPQALTLGELQSCGSVDVGFDCFAVSGVDEVNAGAVGTDAFARGAPATAVIDEDGDCRPGVDGLFRLGR